ncbi:MAG: antitoxin YefM [Marivirga sp.]|jgi:antitoxin YefM
MKSFTITEAQKIIYKLVEQINVTHKPIQITGKRNNAVLVSGED